MNLKDEYETLKEGWQRRAELIVSRLRKGETLKSIGDDMGLTKQRVKQIADSYTAKARRDAQAFPTLAQVDAAKTAADDATPGGPAFIYTERSE